MMMKTTAMTLTIGSTTNCLTRMNVPTNMVFIVVVSTVPIIVPFGTFMTRLTDISHDTTIIRGLVITATAMAMAIGVINSVSGWGNMVPQSDNLAIPRRGLTYKRGLECPGIR